MTDGWIHRIDAVPDIGRMVRIKETDRPDQISKATVVKAWDSSKFTGIGCEVGYVLIDEQHIPYWHLDASKVSHWQYL